MTRYPTNKITFKVIIFFKNIIKQKKVKKYIFNMSLYFISFILFYFYFFILEIMHARIFFYLFIYLFIPFYYSFFFLNIL